MLAEVAAAFGAATTIKSEIEKLGPLARQLRDKPDSAGARLSDALDEIRKTCVAVDAALLKFLLLAERPSYESLLELQGGAALADVELGRGHCSVMVGIFQRYVENWFNRVLSPAEAGMARAVFQSFENADMSVFRQLTAAVRAIQYEATSLTLDYLANGEANVKLRVRTVAREVLELRSALGETLATVVREQWAFRDLAGMK